MASGDDDGELIAFDGLADDRVFERLESVGEEGFGVLVRLIALLGDDYDHLTVPPGPPRRHDPCRFDRAVIAAVVAFELFGDDPRLARPHAVDAGLYRSQDAHARVVQQIGS